MFSKFSNSSTYRRKSFPLCNIYPLSYIGRQSVWLVQWSTCHRQAHKNMTSIQLSPSLPIKARCHGIGNETYAISILCLYRHVWAFRLPLASIHKWSMQCRYCRHGLIVCNDVCLCASIYTDKYCIGRFWQSSRVPQGYYCGCIPFRCYSVSPTDTHHQWSIREALVYFHRVINYGYCIFGTRVF
jgi:hypothetical protein